MNQRLWRFVSRSVVLAFLGILGLTGDILAQATFVSARHETISQREVDVNFDIGISFSGAPTSTGWTVTVNGTGVPITSIGTFGPNTVRIQFNANGIAGHGALETFLKPGEILRVSYAGGGNFNAPGVNPFGLQVSQNNFPFDCGEVLFFNQGIIPAQFADICAPVNMNFYQWLFRVSLRMQNSTGFVPANWRYFFNWGDGSPLQLVFPYRSDLTGAANATFIDPTGFAGNPQTIWASRPTKLYPATVTPTPDCSWNASVVPQYVPTLCNGLTQSTIFATYDTDNANSGTLSMPPSVANSNLVCLGDNVNMQFTDATTLNCRAAFEPTVPNDQARHIRIVYGSRNYDSPSIPGAVNNIPDVRAGGVPVTNNNANGTLIIPTGYFPTGAGGIGVPDFNGVIQLATPVTASTATAFMQTITTTDPSLQQVTQRFYVQIQYWNICNPYNAGNPANPAPVTIENFVEIISEPNPAVPVNKEYCFSENIASGGNCGGPTGEYFEVTAGSVAGSNLIRWYNTQANALADVSAIASSYGTNCRFLRPENRTGGTAAMAAAGVYSVWMRYRIGTNNCLSNPVEVTITRRSNLSAPGAISPLTSDVCNNTNNVIYTLPAAAPVVPFGGGTQYNWSFSGGAGATVDAPGNTQNITADFNIAGAFTTTTRSLDVVTEFTSNATTGGTCQAGPSQRTVTIYGVTQGGTLAGGGNFCEGANVGNITWTPGRGSIVRWEVNINSSGFADAGLGTANPISPGVLAPGNYVYRAVIANGPCAEVNSSTATIDVFPTPTTATAGADQPLCQPLATPSGPLGGNVPAVGTGLWSQQSGPGVITFNPNNTTPNATATASANGIYTVRWTISTGAGLCSTFEDVQLDFGTVPPVSMAGGDQDVCGFSAVMNGNDPTFATGTWLQTGGPGTSAFIPNVNARNATVTVTMPGTYTYRWRLTSGICVPSDDFVDIIFNDPPTVSAPVDFTHCLDNPPTAPFFINLSGTFGGGATQARWERVVGSGTFASSGAANGNFDGTSPVDDVYQPTAADFAAGSVQVRLITDDPAGGCIAVNDPVTITLDRLPAPANADIDGNVANNTTCDGNFVLGANAPTNGGIGSWSSAGLVYFENFTGFANGFTGPDAGLYGWSRDITGITLLAGDYFEVRNGRFSSEDLDNGTVTAFWRSENIDVSALTTIDVSVDLFKDGALEATDFIEAWYLLDGAPTKFGEISRIVSDGVPSIVTSTATATGINVAANNILVVEIRVRSNANLEIQEFDNVLVKENSALPITFSDIFDPNATVSGLPVGVTPITWTISSALGVCSPSMSVVNVTRHALPVANNLTPALCEDAFGVGDATVTAAYLASAAITDGITGIPGSANRIVQFFTDPARTMAVPDPYLVADTDIIYTRVTRTDVTPNCTNDGTITFTVNPLPAANDYTYEVCEETVGSNNKDNNNFPALFDNITTGGAANRTVAWYFDPGGPVTGPGDLPIGNLIPTPTDVDGVANGTRFYALVTNTITGCQNVSDVLFDIQPRPIPNPIIGQPSVCVSGALVVYQLTSIVPGSTYAWTLPANNPGFFEVVFGGGVNDFFVGLRFPGLTAPPASDVYNISVIETSPLAAGACSGAPNNFNITVTDSPAPNPIVGPDPVCKNEAGVAYAVQFPNGANTYAWSITAGDAAIVGPAAGVGRTSIVVDFGTSATSTISVTESSPTGCSLGAPQTLIVNAIDVPVMTSLTTHTICSGESPAAAGVIFTAAPGGNTFNWEAINVPAAVTGILTGATGIGNIANMLTNVSGVDAVVTFEVIPTSTAAPFCEGPPQTVFITVKPQPIIVPGQTKLICSGSNVDYSIQLTPALLPATTIFSWAAPTMSAGGPQGVMQGGIPVGPAGTLHITDNLVNNTNNPITATYHVLAANGACNAYPTVPVIITIDPAPAMAANLTTPLTQCNGAVVNISLSTTVVPTTPADIKWDVVVTQTGGTGALGGTAFANLTNQTFTAGAATLNGSLTNTGNDAATARFVFTPKLQGSSNCPGVALAPIDVVVEPTPLMTRTLTTASTICDGGTVTFDLATVTTPSVPGDIKWDVVVSKLSGTGVAGGTAFANLSDQTNFTAGALSGTLTNSGNDAITVRFVFTPKLQGTSNCPGVALAPVDVVVEPTPLMTRTLATPLTICNGGTVTFDLSTPTTPSNAGDIKWDVAVSLVGGTGPAGGTAFTNLSNQTNFAAGALSGTLTNGGNDDITVRYIFTPKLQGSSNCPGVAMAPVDVVVEPTPLMTRTLATPSTICNGGTVTFDLSSPTVPSTPADLLWDVAVSLVGGTGPAGGTAFANLNNQNNFTVGALSGDLTNGGNDDITVRFIFTPKLQGSSNCPGVAMAPVDVVVEPTPLMTRTLTTPSTICNNGTVTFDLTTPTAPSNAGDIKWDVAVSLVGGTGPAGGTAFTNLSNQTNFTVGALSGTLTNGGNDDITVRYIFTPKLQGTSNCPGVALAPVDVVVEPTPLMTRTLATPPTICNGGTVTFDLSTPTAPSNAGDIKWDVAVSLVGGTGPAGGTAFANLSNQTNFTPGALSGTLTNGGNDDITVRYIFTPKLQGTSNCPGVAMAPIDVVVEPTPTMTRTLTTPTTICNNGTVNFDLSTPTAPSVPADLLWDVAVSLVGGTGPAGGTAFSNLSNQSNFTPGALNGTLTNGGNDDITVRFIFTPKLQGSSNCPGVAMAPVDVVVEPTPTMTRTLVTPPVICNSGTVTFDLSTPTAPSNAGDIKWDVAVTHIAGTGPAGGTAFANLTNQSSFTPGALNGTLTNGGNDDITVRFVFTPKLQGSSNCPGVAMAPVDVIVEPTPTMTRTLTTPSIICNGGNVSFTLGTVTAPNTAGDIKWDVTVTQISGTGVVGGTAFANLNDQSFIAGSASLMGTLTNDGNNAATARFVFTPKLQGSSNCPGVAMAPVDVVIEPTPTAVIGNSTPTICNSGNVNILISSPTVPSTPADLLFDLVVSSSNAPATGGTAFTSLPNQSFPILIGGTLTNSSDNFITITFTVTPKLQGSSNCPGAIVPPTTVIVEPTPKVAFVNNAPRLCNGGTPDIDITSPSGVSVPANLTFDIVPAIPPGIVGAGDAGTGVTSVSAPYTLNAGTLTNNTNIAQTVVYTITPKLSGCVNGPTQVVNVIVEPTPQVSLTNNLAKICNLGTPNITVTSPTAPSSPADLTFDVVVTLPGGVTGTGIAGNGVVGATAPFSINAGVITNTNPTSETITYTVTPKLNGCVDGPSQFVNVIVEPTPEAVVNNLLPTICNVGTPSIDITSPTVPSVPANLTFDVAVALPAGVTGTGIAGGGTTGATAPFSINAGTLTNSTNAFKTVTYTITPRLSGCANGAPQVVNVVVEPSPVAAFVNNAANICSGASPSIDITSPTSPSVPGNLTFDVTVVLQGGLSGTGVAGSGVLGATAPFSINTGTLTHDNLSATPLTATYTITPKLAGCADGTPQVVVVNVRPLPVGAFDNSRVVCSDEAFSYNIQTANIDFLGNGVISNFTFTVSSSDEANVPTPVGLDRTIPSNAPINGNFNNANLAGADVDITYTITPFNAAGACAGAPFDVVVRIQPEPTAPALTTVEHCSDAAVPFTFDLQDIIDTGIGGNSVPSQFTYTVSSTNPLVVFPESNRNVASSAPISQVYSNFSGGDETITYVVTPFSTAGNCQGTNFEFKVIVHPEPVGSNLVDPACSTTLNHNIQTQITNGLASVFTYTVASDNGGVPPGPDRVAASAAPITDIYVNGTGLPANITYTITPFNAANPTCEGSIFTYTVNISPNPTGVSDTKPAVCSDVAFNVDPQANIVPAVASTFTWTATYDFPMTGPANGTGVIAGSLHNETSGQLFAHYTVIPTAGTCVGAAFTIDLPVDPEPVVDPALANPAAVCSTNAISTVPIGVTLDTNGVSVAADSYDISLSSIDAGLVALPGNLVLPASVPANSPSAGLSDAISNDTYRNTTAAQLQVVYTVVPVSADGCLGNAFDITVSINPEPVLATPAWPNVCSSNADISNPVNVVLGTNGTSANAVSYQLQDIQYDDGGGFSPALPANFVPNPANPTIGTSGSLNLVRNDRYRNSGNVPVTVRYTIQGFSSQGCGSEFLAYDVTVDPEPVLQVPVPGLVCSDVISGITLTEVQGSAVATSFNINNIIRQAGLIAGGSNASIGLGQPANAIFNDIFTNTTASTLTVTYKIAPVTAAGCVGEEQDVVFSIIPAPSMATNLDRTVCSDAPASIVLATNIAGPIAGTYRIESITVGGGPGDLVPNGVNLTTPRTTANVNEISGDRYINTTNNPLTVTYRITPIGLAAPNCEGPFRDLILTVEPTMIAAPINNLTDICSATPTDIELLSPSVPTSPIITFNYIAVSSIGGQMSGFIPALNNLPAGYRIQDNLVNNSNTTAFVTYTITAVSNGAASGAGCSSVGVPVVVNVEPKPKLIASPLLQSVCESDGVNISPTNILLTSPTVPTVGMLEFNQISAVATGGMTLLSPLKTTYLNGELIQDQWSNPTLTDQTVTYTLRPEVNGGLGCPGDDVVVTVTVKPRPQITPVAPVAVCSGEFRSIALTTDIPGTFATWTVTPNANVTGELAGGGGSLDFTLFNTGFNVETVTYTVTPKFNNCDGIPTDIVVTVNPTPDITGLPATITVCDGQTLNVPLGSNVPGTTFTWTVTDVFNLEAPGFFDGNGTTINQVINNPNGFQAVLIYQVTPTSVPAGCVGLPRIMNVNVGSIVPNVTPDRTEICSGQRIQMTNSSLGATSHRWFYRVQGTTTEIDVRTTPFVNYQLDNTTTTNPLIYEIVYQPSNGLCTVPDVITTIEVYRNVVAGFNEGTVPPIVGGTSNVNFTNTSNPVDAAQFRYEWDFGSSQFANPSTFTGATPPPIVYSQQGPYQVTLNVINIGAEGAGLQCESTFFKTIVVPVLPLVADFRLEPAAGCFPTTVRVVENNSTGDIMEWKVVDSNGGVVAVSGADLPEFFIATPGFFNVQLTTRDSFTDQVEFANQDFEIYDLPIASFQARPTTLFIPDTELVTFNFSTKANFYAWDFGDGETSDEREPMHVYKIEGAYDIVLVAGFDHGNGVVCTDTLTAQVIAKQGGQTKVPNAFTPNPAGPTGGNVGGGGTGGAGSFNDVFLPIVKGVEEFNMQIFDRWGNLIFESNNANVGWDGYDRNGNIMPAGVYVYKLTLRLSDGQRTTQIGDITMIR